MKAILLQAYGDTNELEYAEAPDPQPGPGELLIKVLGTSINPIDFKVRRGDMKAFMPLEFPAILGRDLAGEVVSGGGDRFQTGQRVIGLVNHSYAELLVAKAEELALVPDGMAIEDAGALPLVLTTGCQLIELGVKPSQGQRVLITGAAGSVGRTAVYVAKQHGAYVIAGVKANQLKDGSSLGADEVVAIDEDGAISRLKELDAIADTVGGDVIGKLLGSLKKGGRLATVVGKPKAAEGLDIAITEVHAKPDAKRLHELATDVANGAFSIPIAQRMPLSQAAEAQALAEKGSSGGKIVLIP